MNEIVEKYTNKKLEKKINISENSNFLYVLKKSNIKIIANISKKDINTNFYVILANSNEEWSQFEISLNCLKNNINSKIYVLNLLSNWNTSSVIGDINVKKNIMWTKAKFFNENIVLWENVKIESIPMLHIDSKNVEVEHWSKIEKISEKNIFYLSMRWIKYNDAKNMIINWYIENILNKFSDDSKKNIWKIFYN